MHATMRYYHGNAELADQLAARSDEVQSLLRAVDGFRSYYMVRLDDATVSITICDDEAGTTESTRVAGDGSERTCRRRRDPAHGLVRNRHHQRLTASRQLDASVSRVARAFRPEQRARPPCSCRFRESSRARRRRGCGRRLRARSGSDRHGSRPERPRPDAWRRSPTSPATTRAPRSSYVSPSSQPAGPRASARSPAESAPRLGTSEPRPGTDVDLHEGRGVGRALSPSVAPRISAVSRARRSGLVYTAAKSTSPRFAASARACARPVSLSGGSACPWKRLSRFQSVSPCLTRTIVVTKPDTVVEWISG